MQLSIIIVNYRVRFFLEQCLHSVLQATAGLAAEIIVVDNDPAEGSIDYLKPKFLDVTFIANTANTGFAKANNLGLQQARGQYVLYLNPDTLLPQHCLHQCLAYLAAHPQVGALGICMVDGSGQYLPESKRAFPAPLTAFFKLFGFAKVFPQSPVFARYYLGHLSPTKNHAVEVLAGAFMLAPKAVLDGAGGFSEDYFMYGEDIDLSYRIQQAGWQNHYFAECPIVHFKGESTKKGSLNYVRLFYGAMGIFVRKYYGGGRAWLFTLFIQLGIGIRAVGTLLYHGIKQLLRLLPKAKPLPPSPLLLWGSLAATQSAAWLLDHAKQPWQRLLHLHEALPHAHLVFCLDTPHGTAEEGIDLERAIATMQRHRGHFFFHFHYAGSGSIVGSHSSAMAGEALA